MTFMYEKMNKLFKNQKIWFEISKQELYLELRLHKQSVKQEINNHRTCLAKPLHTKQKKKVWQTIEPPSMRLLSDLPKICPSVRRYINLIQEPFPELYGQISVIL
jgi:hypothetical protein